MACLKYSRFDESLSVHAGRILERVFQRPSNSSIGMRGSSTRSAVEEKSGLSDVIAVLNGMMEAFNKMVTEDNTNWANYEKLNDQQQADKTSFIQGMKSQVLTCEGQKSAAEGRVPSPENLSAKLSRRMPSRMLV